MKYCRNCGNEVRPDVKVCTHCGHRLDGGSRWDEGNQQGPEPKEPMDPKKKRKLLIIFGSVAAIVIILWIPYSIIASALSPDNQLDAIAEAVNNEDAEAFMDAVDSDITLEEAAAHISYIDQSAGFSQYGSWINSVKSDLDNDASYSEISDGWYTLLSVNSDGSQYLLFDDYSFTVPRHNVYAEDQYDIDAFVYAVDEKEYQWDSETDKFAELIPGIYNFEGSAIIDETSYDSSMSVNFNESDFAVLEPGYFYLNINEYVTGMIFEDVSEEDISVAVNDEDVEVDFSDYDNRVGPFAVDEELDVSATLEYAGETFESNNETVEVSAEDINNNYNINGSEPVYPIELEFDEDSIYDAGDAQRDAEQLEEEREEFEADMEENVEQFIDDYLFALEMMYMMDDIDQIEDYVDEDSEAYSNLQTNLDDGTFEGMHISNISFSNYSEDGNTITIDVESTRDYDLLDSPADLESRYTVEYDPDEVELAVTAFEDL